MFQMAGKFNAWPSLTYSHLPNKQACSLSTYSKLSIIRSGRSRLLEFEKFDEKVLLALIAILQTT